MQNETEKSMFLSVAELNRLLPWSKNIIARMIREGVFKPVRNPLAKGRSKMFFWRLVGNAFEEGRKEAEPCA